MMQLELTFRPICGALDDDLRCDMAPQHYGYHFDSRQSWHFRLPTDEPLGGSKHVRETGACET